MAWHYATYIDRVTAAGKAVLCTKPLARNAAEAREKLVGQPWTPGEVMARRSARMLSKRRREFCCPAQMCEQYH